MGVSGSGKTSIGRLLASEMSIPFIDADDHHPKVNIDKMSQGLGLTDDDRMPWLDKLHTLAMDHLGSGCIIACSALRKIYRERLSHSIDEHVVWIYLKGSYEQIFDRMLARKEHFMHPNMLKSQFETLEEPTDAIHININNPPEIIVKKLKNVFI